MAIENPIIDAGSTVSKAQPLVARVDLYSFFVKSGISYLIDKDTGETIESTTITAPPDYGQIAVELPQAVGTFVATMWVFTSDGWVRVTPSTSFVNPDTGKPWDPLQNL